MIVREPSRVSCVMRALGHLFHVDVVLAHVGHASAVGREFRKHECGLRRVAAQLAQLLRVQIEHPVVAARVHAPNTACVGEDQQLRAIVGPDVVGDGEWRCRAWRSKRRCRYKDLAVSRRRVVPNQIASAARVRRLLQRGVTDIIQPADLRHAASLELVGVPDPRDGERIALRVNAARRSDNGVSKECEAHNERKTQLLPHVTSLQ